MSPSTERLYLLPDIPSLRRLTKSLAMLDAILSPEWEYRFYSFNGRWDPEQELASMRNGSGDDWFLLFTEFGAALKGFDHEAPLASDKDFPARIRQTLPAGFASFWSEPAFKLADSTFCVWRELTGAAWQTVPPRGGQPSAAADGSAGLLNILDGQAKTYQDWAEGYYEREVSLAAVEAVYAHELLGAALVAALNPAIDLADVAADAKEIGYPALPSS